MAFVLVQHLAPTHASALAEILSRATTMPVMEVQDEPTVEPNHVYVIPPDRKHDHRRGGRCNCCRARSRGAAPADRSVLPLAGRGPGAPGHRRGPVRHRHRRHPRAGGDQGRGRHHLRPGRDGPARAACRTAPSPPAAWTSCCPRTRSPARSSASASTRTRCRRPRPAETDDEPNLAQVVQLLRHATGVDFTHYKSNTLYRRITRRMVLQKMDGLAEYVQFLRQTPAEVDALYQDILISVTSFFRDPESFEALKSKVLPRLLKDRSRHDPVRVWTLGCSTGEEAYSLAMAFTEAAEAAGSSRAGPALRHRPERRGHREGPRGRLPEGHRPGRLAGAPAAVLRRGGRQLPDQQVDPRPVRLRPAQRAGRPALLAHRPDQLPQPAHLPGAGAAAEDHADSCTTPSSRRASCGWAARRRSAPTANLFEAEDAKHKIYAKKPGSSPGHGHFPLQHGGAPRPAVHARCTARPATAADLHREADRVLLDASSPRPACSSTPTWTSCSIRGDTGPYLAPAPGKASLNLLKMLREGLLVAVRAADPPGQARSRPRCARRACGSSPTAATARSTIEVIPDQGQRGEGRRLPGPVRGAVHGQRPRGSRRGMQPERRAAAQPSRPGRERPPGAGAGRHPRVPAVGDRAAGGRQRGAAIRQRGGPVGQRGAAEHQRGAGDLQGGDPVEQRRAGHRQRGAATTATPS